MTDTFWMIEETVGRGLFFTHPGIYATRESAEQVAARYSGARAAHYRTGGWTGGPERVEEN
jgi:hypothetical protein